MKIKTIFHGGKERYMSKIIEINGEYYEVFPGCNLKVYCDNDTFVKEFFPL